MPGQQTLPSLVHCLPPSQTTCEELAKRLDTKLIKGTDITYAEAWAFNARLNKAERATRDDNAYYKPFTDVEAKRVDAPFNPFLTWRYMHPKAKPEQNPNDWVPAWKLKETANTPTASTSSDNASDNADQK